MTTPVVTCPQAGNGIEHLSMKSADAGVDIAVADAAKQRIRHHASHTFTPGVLGGIGGFGALFALDKKKWKEPVLVSSADGVGTKLKVAMATGVHSTVGGDLVNHCVNDILVQGAEPLFFLDYLAMGENIVDAVNYEVAAYRGVNPGGHGDFEFGTDTVSAGDEDRLFPFLLVEREERAESTDAAQNPGGEGMAGGMADALLGGVG